MAFPLNQWYAAGFSWELQGVPLGRTLLDQAVVLFRDGSGRIGALEDRCCHRDLPLSRGAVETRGLRCGYHGLLYDTTGHCIEIPGQERIPGKALVRSYTVKEQDQIVWIWFGASPDAQPTGEPPVYAVHGDDRYEFRGDVYHYKAPWQLIHDNILDLSHLGYVHVRTIGGNPNLHMTAQTQVQGTGDYVRVVRYMPGSVPPPTYTSAWPLAARVDRWQEIEFFPNHLRVWSGAIDAGSDSLENPDRGGFHMRGLHCVTPETQTTSHYLWTVASNRPPDRPSNLEAVYKQTAATFDEDKLIIEAQYANMVRFPDRPMLDIHVDTAPLRARRIIARLIRTEQGATQGV